MLCNITPTFCALYPLVNQLNRRRHVMQHCNITSSFCALSTLVNQLDRDMFCNITPPFCPFSPMVNQLNRDMLCTITPPFCALSTLVNQLSRQRHVTQHHTTFLCTLPIGKSATQTETCYATSHHLSVHFTHW